MKEKKFWRSIFIYIVISCQFLLPYHLMAIEEPQYRLLEKTGNFELRQYPSYIEAETLVEGDFTEGGKEGFRRLAD